jgi:putative tryptophan/tyrosine transport system substrate-binding protein
MRRREFLCGIAAVLTFRPGVAIAQSTSRPLVAVLLGFSSATPESRIVSGFLEGMHELAYVEGRNIEITYRYADGDQTRLPGIVREVIQLKSDVIVTPNNFAAITAKNATTTIPIVCSGLVDPVGSGLAASYARPGGNVTGIMYALDLGPAFRWVDAALEMVPGASRMGLLVNASDATSAWYTQFLKTVRASVQVKFVPAEVSLPDELEPTFRALKRQDVRVLVVLPSALFFNEHQRIAELAASIRLPTLFYDRDYVEAGGLMSYGTDRREHLRRASAYVDKILKGAAPGDLSVEFPTKEKLVINMKTAKALGLHVPWKLLARADEVIE